MINARVPQINNRGRRWQGCAVPGAAKPEPEGYRSRIMLQRKKEPPLCYPAPLTCFDHQLECHSSPTAVLKADDCVCVCHAHEIERGRGVRAVSEYQYCFSTVCRFNFTFLKSTSTSVTGEKSEADTDSPTEGDLIWSRFSFGEDWKSNFSTKSIFWSLDQLSSDTDKHESLLFYLIFLENISIENTFRNDEFLSPHNRECELSNQGCLCLSICISLLITDDYVLHKHSDLLMELLLQEPFLTSLRSFWVELWY